MDKQLIDKKKLKVYLNCSGDEDLWGRIKIPKTKLSDEEFRVLSDLDENLKDYYNKYYSKKFKVEIKKKIDILKSKVTNEVFQMLERDKI